MCVCIRSRERKKSREVNPSGDAKKGMQRKCYFGGKDTDSDRQVWPIGPSGALRVAGNARKAGRSQGAVLCPQVYESWSSKSVLNAKLRKEGVYHPTALY